MENNKPDLKKPAEDQWAYLIPVAFILLPSAVIYFLMIKVIPTFEDVFASFGAKLPWPTQVVIDASEFLRKPVGFFIFFSILGLMGFLIYGKTAKISPDRKLLVFLKVGAFFLAFLGPAIGFIVLAMFCPMFELGK